MKPKEIKNFKCGECGAVIEIPESEHLEVAVDGIIRLCGHNTSPIVAEMEAIAYGVGGLQD